MSLAQTLNYSNTRSGVLVPVIGAAMSLPIVMFSLMGYDINPAFLLAPIIGVAFLMTFGRTALAYIATMVFGLISIFAANKISPDGDVVKHIFSLVLIMFAPSFLFLGKYVSKTHEIGKVFYWLSLFSALFLIVVTTRILYLEQDVRIYIGTQGLAAMNAEFFGLPVFATFGVLSLAHLVCLQAVILCGTLIGGKASKPVSVLLWVALFCASFLIIGSDSRSAQILLVWILGAVVVYAFRNADARRACVVVILTILMAFAVTYARGMNESRMLSSIEAIRTDSGNDVLAGYEPLGSPQGQIVDKKWEKQADQFATGRVELAIAGFNEVKASPIIGSGFAGYGRYSTEGLSKALEANTSTHVYYLTLLWKGGLIFFIPIVVMLLLNLKAAIAVTKTTARSAERFFAWAAVLMAFGPMAMAWDILIVPSAGALAFFLFGLLATTKKA
ncbi:MULTISPECIES: O-antigen ligase [unclassified Pseudomonas]|uniref:O-antigen ligase family protein n=1 Tax=unclassified Pseudomonas TaxID=196821 RepID=UPI00155E14E7|nr:MULTISPECIES: O-antigen ligase family protein [unclassified Pseudomonas]MDF9883135.1 hypothetical protein [Pseudomonas silensiensis]QKG68659.1 O-antigen ligase family protein [Pseudomonas sp. B14-6]